MAGQIFNWADFSSAFCGLLTTSACAAGLSEVKAERVALEVMSLVRSEFGGHQIYIQKGRVEVSELAAELYARRSDGSTVRALAKEKGLTEQRIYQLIGMERERLREIRQRLRPK